MVIRNHCTGCDQHQPAAAAHSRGLPLLAPRPAAATPVAAGAGAGSPGLAPAALPVAVAAGSGSKTYEVFMRWPQIHLVFYCANNNTGKAVKVAPDMQEGMINQP